MLMRVKHFLGSLVRPLTKRYVRIVVTRGEHKFTIEPDAFDRFPLKTGDHLHLVPSGSEEARTPDSSVHVRRSDGTAIRVPPNFVSIPYRGFSIPEHLMILTGAGAVTWEAIGEKHVTNYAKFMGLGPGMTFLEIGCGIGRDALQLIEPLGPDGRYIGVDVTRDSIVWCKNNISAAHSNFEFYHFDAEHELYNPLGTNTSLDFKLPVPDKSVDRIALGSVFTHLFEQEIVHYMQEIGRVLKQDGLAYATFFLYSEETIAASRKNNLTPSNLRFEHSHSDGCFINDASYPTGAVAFTDAAMQRMIRQSGLKLVKPYLRGWWSGLHAEADDGQEVAILARA
jgi:SAM-dependent methyltransferase